jgi:tetratricopeptide (TPR) repeat protein
MRRSVLIIVLLTGISTVLPAVGVRADSTGAFSAEVDVQLTTLRHLIEAKDYTGSLTLAEQITTQHPEVSEGWVLLGYVRSVTSHFDESNVAYDHALEHGADREKVMAAKAYNCRKLGDVAQTRACYREIVDMDRDNVDAWVQFASFEASVENYDSAVEYYTTALNLDPNNVDLIESVARTEEKRGNIAQATAWLETGLSHDPNNTRFLKRLAAISLNAQDYVRAVGYCDRALAVDPTDATVQRNRGVALYQKGDKKEAIASLEKVSELGGKMDGLYGPLADCYRAAGRNSDALRVINDGIAAGNQAAWLYSLWGKILEDQKHYDEAIAKFNAAVSLNDELWSDYARKQIARQNQLKKREAMIASQGGEM